MTERLPMPEDASQPPARKPTRIPWKTLISIIVVGGVVAVGMSSHGDYGDRAQVLQAVALLSNAKAPLADYYETHKKWPQSLADVPSGASKNDVESVAITQGAGGAAGIGVTEARSRVGSIQATPELVNDAQAFARFQQAQASLRSVIKGLTPPKAK